MQATVPRGTLFPTVGGSDVPNQPRTALGKIPLLIGGNTLEAGFNAPPPPATQSAYEATLAQVYGSQASGVEAQYPFSGYAAGEKPLIQAETDWDPQPGAPEITWCYDVRTFQLQSASAAAYAYEFNDPNAPSATGAPEGPIHTAELQYLFPSTTDPPLSGDSKALSSAMVLYWSHFIATGNPNGSGLPNWPAYQSPTDAMQFIPGRIGTGIDVNAEHKCPFWNSLGDAV